MAAVDSQTIADIIKGILSVAGGGLPSWIATGVLGIIAIFVAWWVNKKLKDLQNKANDKNRENDQAGTDPISGGAENEWDKAAKKTEETLKKNPDDGKKPLDPVE